MRKDNFDEEFIAKIRATDFSSESKNKEGNLEILKGKLATINKEREINMKKGIRKPVIIAACVAAVMTISVTAFGQDLVRYVRSTMLGDHAHFVVVEDDGNAVRERSASSEIEDVVTSWLTFYDAEEGRSHFITDALLPSYLPNGYAFSHIFYFVESMETLLQEYGANKYMGVVFTDGAYELQMQARFMDETTGFALSATDAMRTVEINGHEAVIDVNTLSILIGDVMYFFFGNENIGADELVKIAESLN